MKTLTMITRHGVSKDNIGSYTLITPDYQTIVMSAKDLAGAISSKKIAVTNLTVGPKGIESTNGALDKYTFINTATNQVEGTTRAVILDRVEQGGKLLGYTVFTQAGTIAELNVADAAALAEKKLISNGKIKHTAEGDIVSAIGGTYPLRVIEISKAPKGELSIDVLYFGTAVDASAEYFGAIISCTSATEMSKLVDILSKSNAKVVGTIAKVAGQSVRESLAIKRMGANSLYGVFETSVLEKLIKANAVLKNNIGAITVSAVKYSGGDTDEATIKLSKDWKIVNTDIEGSDAADKVKAYTKKIMTAFSNTVIK